MDNQLKVLRSKLDANCYKTLEHAAAICMRLTHYNVEIEHWLLALLECEDSVIVKMLKTYGCDFGGLDHDINLSLETLQRGNTNIPAISNRIIDLINEAWLIASLDYGGSQINSGIILCALLQNHTLKQICHALSKEFTKIDINALHDLIPQTQPENKSKSNRASAPDQFAVNLNEQAKLGKIDPAIGRENEISQIIDILARRKQNNAILTGEPGVGKTAIVEGLARRIVNQDVPDILKPIVIYALDLGLLQAGAGIKGEFESRLKNLINEIKAAAFPIVLFIDEAHILIGAGAQAGQGDAANLLKPALARGELRCIAATTWAEYKKYFEQDAALARRFQVIKVAEPDIASAIQMLRGLSKSFAQHHKVKILENAINAAVLLSERYISDRYLPDKAISVLDTACARIALQMQCNVDDDTVAQVIADWTGIPVGRMLKDDISKIIDIEARLQQRIIGQDHALREIAASLRVSSAKLTDPNKPIGIFLFIGPSGVGKTETALALAEFLYNSDKKITIINMSEFKEEHKISMLTGSPPGYVGYGEGGILTEAVRRNPYSIILLDEMEKAHAGVQEVFYQVFDKGTLKDGQGRDINFKNTLIIMASNACQNELHKIFKPAFLGRVTVVPYQPLSANVLRKIIKLKLARVSERLKDQHKINLNISNNTIEFISKMCTTQNIGARQIDNILQAQILPRLAEIVLTSITENKTIKTIKMQIKENNFIYMSR